MGQPPRLAGIKIPSGTAVVYFVTLCVDQRQAVLATVEMFGAIQNAIAALRNWDVKAGVIMPDHAHFMVEPNNDRDLSVADFAIGFKKLLKKQLPTQNWQWQRGCFDRLLRSGESAQEKWLILNRILFVQV
jgi:REP element-mobilizing transposase RayT